MKGFFDSENIGFFPKKSGKNNKKQIIKKDNCEICGLYKDCINPKMEYAGEGKKKILILRDFPYEYEDKNNLLFSTSPSKPFKNFLSENNFDLYEDFWVYSVIRCRPKRNKIPTTKQLKLCREYLMQVIDKLKPVGIILLGKLVYSSLIQSRLSGRLNNMNFTDFIYDFIYDNELKCYLLPVNPLNYILSKNINDNNALKKNWIKYVKEFIYRFSNNKHVNINYDKFIDILFEEKQIIQELDKIKNDDFMCFDYETTGIKPHTENHKIICASISTNRITISFELKNDAIINKFKELLQSDIKKIAHNIKYEEQWSRNILNVSCKNWYWDTMIAQHCLDNRKKTSLKYLVYKYFGEIGYDSDISKYIETDDKSCNSKNDVEKCDINKLLSYCGLDSMYTREIYYIQKEQMNEHILKGFNLFLKGSLTLLDCTENGFKIDGDKLNKIYDDLYVEMIEIENKINNSEYLKKWDWENKFNFNSSKDLRHLLFDILKIKSINKTSTGLDSIDVSTFAKLNHPFTSLILQYRKIKKIRDTYLSQYKREVVNNFIHPSFNLHIARTFRSSCSNPNIQNVPKRDKNTKKMIRSLIIPRKGNMIVEYDYKSVEVCIAACYTQDPKLIEYVTNLDTDMHRDMACQIFLRNKDNFLKEERQDAKNAFVFPNFYGSFYKQTAPDLWERANNRQDTTLKNLKEHGIKNYISFENHIKKIEYDFWYNRFKVYTEWKKKTFSEYENKLYTDLYTGFRCQADMNRKEVINYRIQGSAFHCVLWSMNKINRHIKKLKNSFMIGQIHDSILFDVHPDDEKYIDELVYTFSTQKIKKYWNWINVPLQVEKEKSKINGSFAEMQDCGYLRRE
jgi:uracil-DNA glycosylase family 4